MKFDINFNIKGCNLEVIDNTVTDAYTGSVDFVCYMDGSNEPTVISAKSKHVSTLTKKKEPYKYQLEKDGRYRYYKLYLPFYEEIIKLDVDELDTDIKYCIFGKQICKVCWNKVSMNSEAYKADLILIDDLKMTLLDVIEDLDDQVKLYTKDFFNICKLEKCVLSRIEKQLLSGDCHGDCAKTRSNKNERLETDFLYATLYIIKYYISIGDFDKADELLDNISSCGSNLCDENNLKNCNCNG